MSKQQHEKNIFSLLRNLSQRQGDTRGRIITRAAFGSDYRARSSSLASANHTRRRDREDHSTPPDPHRTRDDVAERIQFVENECQAAVAVLQAKTAALQKAVAEKKLLDLRRRMNEGVMADEYRTAKLKVNVEKLTPSGKDMKTRLAEQRQAMVVSKAAVPKRIMVIGGATWKGTTSRVSALDLDMLRWKSC